MMEDREVNVSMNKMIDWEYRYELDFIRFPVLIHRAQRKVIDLIIGGSYVAMSSLYNKGWPGGKTDRFSPEDFKCRIVRNGADTMLYITLPATDACAPMACTHIAITYKDNGIFYSDIRVFNVERSNRQTTAIGEMQFTPDGQMKAHMNYGGGQGQRRSEYPPHLERRLRCRPAFPPLYQPRECSRPAGHLLTI